MKKELCFCFVAGLFCMNNAFSGEFVLKGDKTVSDEVALAWGKPYIDKTFIQDAIREPKGFRIKEGWACCTSVPWKDRAYLPQAERTENRLITKKQDVSLLVFLARTIYEHGGRFCLTQLGGWRSDGGFGINHQQPNWPEMPCMVLCEPGWDGATCDINVQEGTTGNDTPCDTTDIAANVERIKQSGPYQSNDSLTFHKERMGVADEVDFFARIKIFDYYEHVVYLGATEFMRHGVVAQPMLVAAAGDTITSLNSGPALSSKVKTLCAQGFTKNDKCEINSKNCSSNVWCTGYSDADFKSNIHKKVKAEYCNVIFCKDGTLALDSDFNCVTYDGYKNGRCEQKGSILYGKLVRCKEGEIFESETCECGAAKTISKEVMQYGRAGKNSEIVTDQCWTRRTDEDFQNCVFDAAPTVPNVTE